MQLTLGFSPCPNDTFMLDALIHGRVSDGDITWQEHIEDVETLNRWALEGKLDVTKMSFSTFLRVEKQYQLLHAGSALGFGCGPLVIAKSVIPEEELMRGPIAIPGELTTANLLFSLRYPKVTNKVAMVFSEIEGAVLSGKVVAGVIIHENRFTYAQHGLVKLLDLGEYWEKETGHPIPLGAFTAKRSLGPETIDLVEKEVRASVDFAFEEPAVSMPFVKKHAQSMEPKVMAAHIKTYVNKFSLNLGPQGLAAVEMLRSRALQHGFIG